MPDARVDRLEAALARLADAQAQTQTDLRALTQRVDQLAEAQRRTEEQLAFLVQAMTALSRDVADLKGDNLERRHREHADAYFAPILERLHVLSVAERSALLADARASSALLDPEIDDLRWADIIAHGRDRGGPEAFLVVEVSSVIDSHDVDRVAHRASVVARTTGQPSFAAVAGPSISPAAIDLCQQRHVWQIVDGRATPPPVA